MKLSPNALVVCALAALFAPAATSGQDVATPPAQPPATQAPSQQPPPEQVRRPFRGLFAAPFDPRAARSLVLTSSVFAAYDDNILARDGQGGAAPAANELKGYYSGAQTALQFSQSGRTASFGAQAGAAVRYYPTLDRFSPVYNEGAHFGTAIGANTEMALTQQFLYTPNYRFNLFPSLTAADAPDEGIDSGTEFDLFTRTAYRHAGGLSLSQRLTRVSTLSADYSLRYVDFTDDNFQDLLTHAAGAGYSRRLTEHATLVLGYHYRRADYGQTDEPEPQVHNIDAGVDYSRSLSFTRRTMFSFSTGSTVVNSRRFVAGQPPGPSRLRIRAAGSASLTHEIGRTWTASLRYHRGLSFREGFNEPFYTDATSAQLQGLVSRRLDVSAGAGYAHASLVSGGNRGYNALTASTQARYALSRFLAAYVSYFYYQYDFNGDIALDPRTAASAHRNGVRVGLSTSVPLIR
jgi:opacity protein-like surface antigen